MAWSRAGILLTGVAALCVGGCGDSHDVTMGDLLAAEREVIVILEGVKDEASAQAAVPQLEALAIKIQRIRIRWHALGDPPLEVRKALQAKYDAEFEKVTETEREMVRRLDPKIVSILDRSLRLIAAARIS